MVAEYCSKINVPEKWPITTVACTSQSGRLPSKQKHALPWCLNTAVNVTNLKSRYREESWKKLHLQINKIKKKETRVAIGAPAYRRTIERRAAASTKASKRKTKQSKTNVTPEKNFMTCANQTPGGYKFVALVASQQGRANQHDPLALGYPLLGPSRHVRAFHCMPQSSLGFLCNDPFRHEMFRPLFRRSAPFPLVLGCSMYINCCGQITSGLARSATCKLVSDT